jgi:serine protease
MSAPLRGALRSACKLLLLGFSFALAVDYCRPAYADDEAPPQRVIVKFRKEALATPAVQSNRTGFVADFLSGVRSRLNVDLTHERTLSTGGDVARLGQRLNGAQMKYLLDALKSDTRVEYAEEDRLLQPSMTPNDGYYSMQWDFYEANGGIDVPTAWDKVNGHGVVVADIDTGYRPHADLIVNILSGYDMISVASVANDGNGRDSDATDPGDWTTANQCYSGSPASNSSWHGTHTAGTLAALTNNASGVAGIAFGAKILPVRVLGRCGGYTSDIADAIVWASGGSVSGVPINTTPAKVLNLSLGGKGSCDSTTQAAINGARSRGATVVVAAGNNNADASGFTPANCSGVIAVAATDRNGARAYYSNYGSIVALSAPGGDMRGAAANGILSTFNSGTTKPGSDTYAYYQGTSMATPHVAAAAALLYAAKSSLTPDQVRTALVSTARPFPSSCTNCGAGILDTAAAVNYVLGQSVAVAPSCPSGYTSVAASLSGTSAVSYAPNSGGKQLTRNGALSGRLSGPSGSNFDGSSGTRVGDFW